MTALKVIREGLATAAELAALLFVAPAIAATEAPQQAHAWTSAHELHGLGSLGGFRLVHAVQNADALDDSAEQDASCEGNADELNSEDEADNAHAVLAIDEAIADRSALRSGIEAYAFFVNDGEFRYLALIPPAGIEGPVTLTLRPRNGSSEVLALGRRGRGEAVLIARTAGSRALDQSIEVIELEWRSAREVSWVTVPVLSAPRGPAASTVASVSN